MRADLPQSELMKATVNTGRTIRFARQTVHSGDLPFKRIQQGSDSDIKGTIPAPGSHFHSW